MKVGVRVKVGVEVGVGVEVEVGVEEAVRVAVGVKVEVGVMVGVRVQETAVAVRAVAVMVDCCSGEGPQPARAKKVDMKRRKRMNVGMGRKVISSRCAAMFIWEIYTFLPRG